MAFVPEGQADSSQARSAWSHEKNSPVPAGRLNGPRLRFGARQQDIITISLGTEIDFDRPSRTAVFLYRYPGTAYLATILLSLRDKMHSPAEALLKLMLMGGCRTRQG
jgi:hypothetical protein